MSRPFDDYPQEIVLRLPTLWGKDHDTPLVAELAAVLTLLSRRLITVYTKVRGVFRLDEIPVWTGLKPWMLDWPAPVANATVVAWSPRPATLLTGKYETEVQFNDPAPKGFDSQWVGLFFNKLPSLACADVLIRVARLYATAMAQIQIQPEAAYQLLISCSETMGGAALNSWIPSETEILADQEYKRFSDEAKREGLSDDIARRLTIRAAALKEHWWVTRKFVKFLMDNADWKRLEVRDDLFCVPDFLTPKPDRIKNTLRRIYASRSKATHEGEEFPASAGVGCSPMIPRKVAVESLGDEDPFPPVTWFERVVNSAVMGYARTELEGHESEMPA